ncbi:MAG TPA: DUF3592 domain-containing protein [Niabella sp.]|nr:DUF3592 domain-containing protein [Niabella sp.]HQW15806.1 DUF3592 domain-containing protein [Niabella sp.]HQX20946.1 DUF3592 domain-containing protein [Niabella sp.]HQX41411.1 DUF3592 domain-containing protein [Niabella sp.]HRB07240.1 DUF3592 domain-containing protein [Niabella sp.]
MIFLYFFMIAFGALPLTILLVKLKRYKDVLKKGQPITAQVTQVSTRGVYRGPTISSVAFAYIPAGATVYYTGYLQSKPGKYRSGDTIGIYYLPDKPRRYAVPGNKGHWPMLVLFVQLFLFVIYACYQLNKMVGDQEIYFNP